jgi:hypothetical protein
LNVKLSGPLRELFKDEVRLLARALGRELAAARAVDLPPIANERPQGTSLFIEWRRGFSVVARRG